MSNLPAKPEGDYFINEARVDAGMGRILSFNKGDYFIDGTQIPIDTEYVVYCGEWIKQWIKFGNNSVEDRKVYHVSRGESVPIRETLGDLDQSKWLPGFDGKPKDPWVLQYLVPFESVGNNEIVVFRTSSWGGRRAVGDLMMAYGHRARREGGNPLVKLAVAHIQSKKFGRIARPDFPIMGWSGEDRDFVMPAIKEEMEDSIPF